MRGMDNGVSSNTYIEGHRIFYNYIRPHMSLNGKTPAEQAGIKQGLGSNRWLDLIKKASQKENGYNE
jgi:hypothetical protein